MRVAPVGLLAADPFGLGCELAALTHGHPSGFLAAGAFALMIARLYAGSTLEAALDAAVEALSRSGEEASEVLAALAQARRAAAEERATPETVQSLGAGWIAKETLAIAVFSTLKARDFAEGVLLAVNHSGDSDSTGSIAGNLLGVMLGEEALPDEWVQHLEARHLLIQLADDLGLAPRFTSDPFFEGMTSERVTPRAFRERYPGF